MSENTWRKMMNLQGEELIEVAPYESVLDVEFDDGYGMPEGPHFLAWTETRVFFPVVYDGAEWVDSVPRNPIDEGREHVGGW